MRREARGRIDPLLMAVGGVATGLAVGAALRQGRRETKALAPIGKRAIKASSVLLDTGKQAIRAELGRVSDPVSQPQTR